MDIVKSELICLELVHLDIQKALLKENEANTAQENFHRNMSTWKGVTSGPKNQQ